MPDQSELQLLIEALKQSGFQGDIETDYASRVVASTDNSIYQLTPQAIFYPRVEQDINRLMRCLHQHRSYGFSLCARGAGTGTNGQSLSDSLVMDCSRHLNQIMEYDRENQTVSVQPGVVLDQLNAYLKPHNVFFPVDISSSSRATIGGMVATDASGKGSLIYGKTSSYIESMQLVLSDGSDYNARAISLEELGEDSQQTPDFLLPIFSQLAQYEPQINERFSGIQRGLTGYNLKQAIQQAGVFNPCFLLAGSEGTLALTRQITLRVIPRPRLKMLTVIFYRDFQKGLEHVQALLESKPAAIEMLDDRILQLAQSDSVWFKVKSIFGDIIDTDIKALNYVEHVADDEQQLLQQQQRIQQILDQTAAQYTVITSKTERNPQNITALWAVRKQAVGLLGKSINGKRGIAFVEDTAVPVENLAQYISGFRKILDQHQLEYGMYGHADAGVLHVRPALDLFTPQERKLIRIISDQVAELAIANQGVLWGEHGRGLRGEYSPLFFGQTLYPLLCDIKNHFDPFDLLNRGKLVRPSTRQNLTRLDDVSYRAEFDSLIPEQQQQQYAASLSCNGNGLCFHWSADEAMCPSYRATANKRYSPKGRAALIREWLRRQPGIPNDDISPEIEKQLYDSLALCLSCKSCTSSCPLKVDIAEMKSRFLEHWHQQHSRQRQDFFIQHFDRLIGVGSKLAPLSNMLLGVPIFRTLISGVSGLTRLPRFSTSRYQGITRINFTSANNQLNEDSVVILCDNYIDAFNRPLLQASCRLLAKLGCKVYLSQPVANGKLLHVKGYRNQFKVQAQEVIESISSLAQSGCQLISVETVSRLMFDMEYPDITQQANPLNIQSMESFLLNKLADGRNLPALKVAQSITLLPHCLEQTSARESPGQWQEIFALLGLKLNIANAGCCGMSGIFGHEVEQQQLSQDIFNLNWKPRLQKLNANREIVLASGFSCRCQAGHYDFQLRHPLEFLDKLMV